MRIQYIRLITLALLVSGIVACQVDGGTPGEIVIGAEDGLQLHAYLEPSPDKSANAPLLVLLPMRSRTHTSYDGFKAAMTKRFSDSIAAQGPRPHIVTLDLRGHGASIIRGKDTVSYESMPNAEYLKIPADVALVIDSVLKGLGRRVQADKIYVVGASIGANAAVMVTELRPDIAKVVLLSPGSDYRSMQPGEAFAKFEGEALIVASRGDGYAYDSSQQLMKLKMKGWLLKAYPGTHHGTTLLDEDKRAMKDVLEWLFP